MTSVEIASYLADRYSKSPWTVEPGERTSTATWCVCWELRHDECDEPCCACPRCA